MSPSGAPFPTGSGPGLPTLELRQRLLGEAIHAEFAADVDHVVEQFLGGLAIAM